VELLTPCTIQAAERIQSFLMKLEADLPDELRNIIGMAFKELLVNAVEWGGKPDPNRKVRIAHELKPGPGSATRYRSMREECTTSNFQPTDSVQGIRQMTIAS
jgi:two-component sensor histidine kinase